MTVKSSERTILRIKDLKEQPQSRYALLPGGLDRVIVACDYYEIASEVLTVYGPKGPDEPPLFSCPVRSGFVILNRDLCELETVEAGIRRMHDDEQEAEKLAEELHGKDPKKPGPGSKVRGIRPDLMHLDDPDFEPLPPTGQYL